MNQSRTVIARAARRTRAAAHATSRSLGSLLSGPSKAACWAGLNPGGIRQRLPDFICLGAQKAGTSWLMSNLARHPEICLPPHIKHFDVHYFDRHFHRPLAWYAAHFRQAGDRKKGENTPAYGLLPVWKIAFVRRLLPDLRLLFMLRNPVDRAWSHAVMNLVSDRRRPFETVSDDEFIAHFHLPRSRARGDYLAILGRWERCFGDGHWMYGFFDEVTTNPRGLLSRVFQHLDVSTDIDWDSLRLTEVVNPAPAGPCRIDFVTFWKPCMRLKSNGCTTDLASRWPPGGAKKAEVVNLVGRLNRKIRRVSAHAINRIRYEFVYVLSDSHGHVFRHLNSLSPKQVHFDVTVVGGGTAMGMVNPNSRTDCLNIFRQKLATINRRSRLIFLLGEVDTGFVIWYRARKYNLPVASQFEQSLQNYFEFISQILADGYQNVCLMSAPLPTIPDNNEKHGEIAGLRREVQVDQRTRTELTLRYNARLREFCHNEGLTFLDLDSYLLGDNGIIRDEYLNRDPRDHHCDFDRYGAAIREELQRAGWLSDSRGRA